MIVKLHDVATKDLLEIKQAIKAELKRRLHVAVERMLGSKKAKQAAKEFQKNQALRQARAILN